jgi:hypothetical protein
VLLEARADLGHGQGSGSRAAGGTRQARGGELDRLRDAELVADLPSGDHLLNPLPYLGPFLVALQARLKQVLKLIAQCCADMASLRTAELADQAARQRIDEATQVSLRIVSEASLRLQTLGPLASF